MIAGRGDPTYEHRLRAIYAGTDVSFLGYREPADFFPNIDVLVAPSLWNEPFGLVIPEAHRWGVPVIASRRGGIPELIKEAITGFLFEPESPGELDALIQRLIQQPETLSAMRPACVRSGEAFTPERVWCEYKHLYDEVRGRSLPRS